jgi:hypothetical protein
VCESYSLCKSFQPGLHMLSSWWVVIVDNKASKSFFSQSVII